MSLHFLLLKKCNDIGEIPLLAMVTHSRLAHLHTTFLAPLEQLIMVGWYVMVVRFFNVCRFCSFALALCSLLIHAPFS